MAGKISNRLFDCDSVEEQKAIFDQRITGPLLRNIFKIAFHPRIYKDRGIDPAGLTHSGARNIAEFFFHRFRNFCCNTLSQKELLPAVYFLQPAMFTEALPEFLQPVFHDTFVKNSPRIEFRFSAFDTALKQSDKGRFINKLHLSNIGDWMSKESMAGLFSLIRDNTSPGTRAVLRYIHMNHELPASLPELSADYMLGERNSYGEGPLSLLFNCAYNKGIV